MYFCLQIPITDLRPFYKSTTYKLDTPKWPSPDSFQMVRYFGPTGKRPNGGIPNWMEEEYVCFAHNAVRLKRDTPTCITLKDLRIPFRLTNRYFNADGANMAKFEIGIIDNFQKKLKNFNGKANDVFDRLISAYAKLPVSVDGKNSTLYKSGQQLKKLYLKASTQINNIKVIDDHLIQSGDPVILVVYNRDIDNVVPEHAKELLTKELEETGKSLHFYRKRISKTYYLNVWLIGQPSPTKHCLYSSDTELRNLRLNILRVNSELEVLRQVLNFVESDKVDLKGDNLMKQLIGKKLNKLTDNLTKKSRYNHNQTDLLNYSLMSYDQISPGKVKNLNSRYQKLIEALDPLEDKYVQEKVKKLGLKSLTLVSNSKNVIIGKVDAQKVNVGDKK